MNRKKSFEITDELLNKIIASAYGDAGFLDRLLVKRLAAKYENINNLFENYRQTAMEVHQIKEEEFPEELMAKIEKRTINIKKEEGKFTTDLLMVIFRRPVLSAVFSIMFLCAVIIGVFMNSRQQPQYSLAEIQRADMQAKQALAIVGKIFEQTNTTLKEEVLKSRVAKPIRESLGL